MYGRITLDKQSDKFPIQKGVRHGDTISPKLSIALLEGIFRKFDWKNTTIRINGEYLSQLRFADDIVLLSKTAEHLQKILE